jgi:hypothetical protein
MSEKVDPGFGLFTITCRCGTTFPVEDIVCPTCQQMSGELKLDIAQFLDRTYRLSEEGRDDRALDVIFDVFWNLHDHFDVMNDILGQLDFNRLNSSLMVGLMVQTFKYAKQVPNHRMLCDKSEACMRERGADDKKIAGLVEPYRADADEFWQEMEQLGAPQWLTGPKPQRK